MTCPDCNGTGYFHGKSELAAFVEICANCGATGVIQENAKQQPPQQEEEA